MSARIDSPVGERLLRQAERLSLRIGAFRRAAAIGEHQGRGQTSSFELLDYRAYAPGDDFRRVDWNAFARLNTLNVRLSEPRQGLVLHLLVDCSESMKFGTPAKSRLAQQIAATLAYIALAQLDGVRLYTLHGATLARSPRYWGKAQAADAFRRLQRFEHGGATDLQAALGAFLAGHSERGLAVVLTDLLSPTDYRSRLKQLVQAGFEVAVLHTLCDDELQPRISGNLEIADSETGQRRRVGLTSEALEAYRQRVSRWQTDLADELRRLGIGYVPLVSSSPIEAVLLRDLRRYGILD